MIKFPKFIIFRIASFILKPIYRNKNLVIAISDYDFNKYTNIGVYCKDRNHLLGFTFVILRQTLKKLEEEGEPLAKEIYLELLNDYFDKRKK